MATEDVHPSPSLSKLAEQHGSVDGVRVSQTCSCTDNLQLLLHLDFQGTRTGSDALKRHAREKPDLEQEK